MSRFRDFDDRCGSVVHTQCKSIRHLRARQTQLDTVAAAVFLPCTAQASRQRGVARVARSARVEHPRRRAGEQIAAAQIPALQGQGQMIVLFGIRIASVGAVLCGVTHSGQQIQPVVIFAKYQFQLLRIIQWSQLLRIRQQTGPVVAEAIDRHRPRCGMHVQRRAGCGQFGLECTQAARQRLGRGNQGLFLTVAQQLLHLAHEQPARQRQCQRGQRNQQEFEAQGHGEKRAEG